VILDHAGTCAFANWVPAVSSIVAG
jgi:hypothetical protein